MWEVAVEGALKGIGAFLFGLLLVAIIRLFSRSTAANLEQLLNLPSMGKPSDGETPPVAESVFQPSQDQASEARVLREIAEYVEHANDIRIVPVDPRVLPPPPLLAPPLPADQPPAPLPHVSARSANSPWTPILAVVGTLLVVVAGAMAWRAYPDRATQDQAYLVQPYTPTSDVITARDRVEARVEPDTASRVVVIFGQGVTMNVSGRVQRGLGNDWYAISWNNQTAFVRTQDVVPDGGSPPAPVVRERQPDEEEDKEGGEKPDELSDEEQQVAETPSFGGGTLGIGEVNWIREASARDFARYFPDQALEEGQSGSVTLSCIIGGSGRLTCSITSESPQGYGFGDAAIGISRQLRVRTTLPDGSSAEGREMSLPLSFHAN